MKESELAEKFIEYFSDFEIFKEVPASGIIDFVVRDGNILTAVEVKTRLSFEVIEQAFMNTPYCHYSYIAVPFAKTRSFQYFVCRKLGIGVLEYHKKMVISSAVDERVRPKLNRKIVKPKLEEYMKQSVAGSQNARQTAFKNTVKTIVRYIQKNPGCSLKDCIQNIDTHYSSISTAKSSIYQWVKRGIITEFYLDKGKLFLREAE